MGIPRLVHLSVIGTGYLGATHAVCLASWGHSVVGVDADEERVARLQAGIAPFHEPGLVELLHEGLASGRLSFTTDLAAAAAAEVHFLCVGTPQSADTDAADLTALYGVVAALSPMLDRPAVGAGRSTVPVGTAADLAARIEYRGLDPVSLAAVVDHPRVIDGRLVLDPDKWRAAGWDLRALGRRSI